jgi:phenylacetate-CoA ligase
MSPEMFSDTVKDISAKEGELVADMKSMLGISPKVTLVAPRSIARSEGKAVRVIDRRKI